MNLTSFYFLPLPRPALPSFKCNKGIGAICWRQFIIFHFYNLQAFCSVIMLLPKKAYFSVSCHIFAHLWTKPDRGFSFFVTIFRHFFTYKNVVQIYALFSPCIDGQILLWFKLMDSPPEKKRN